MLNGHNSLSNNSQISALQTVFLCVVFSIVGSILFPQMVSAAITQFETVPTGATFPTVVAHEIAFDVSSCANTPLSTALDGETHFLFHPTTVPTVNQVIVYFHGDNTYDFEDFCSGGSESNPSRATVLGACHALSNNQNTAILAFRRPAAVGNSSGDWFSGIGETGMSCLMNEISGALSQAGIATNPSYTFAGWSSGGGTIRNLISWLPPSNIVVFDGCYGDPTRGGWCSTIVQRATSGHKIFFYYDEADPGTGNDAGTDTNLRGPELCAFRRAQLEINEDYHRTEGDRKNLEACRSREVIEDNPNKATGILVNGSHYGIPAQCITDFLQGTNPSRCGGAGTIDQLTGTLPPTAFTGGSAFAGPQLSEIPLPEALVEPQTRIKIPGLTFSSLEDSADFLFRDARGATILRIPFLGEYIAAIYRFAIAISSIIAAVLILVSGIQWISSGGGEGATAAKQRIVSAVIGLALAATSYLILFTINPDLVKLQHLNIFYIEPEVLIGTGDEAYNYTIGGMARGMTGRDWRNIPGTAPQIVNRELLVPDANSFCFPLANEGRRYNINRLNWGQARTASQLDNSDLVRCHAGADLIVDGANYSQSNLIGTVYSMTAGRITFIQNEGFLDCSSGRTSKSNPGEEEPTGSIGIYDPVRNLLYVYGEMNKDSTNHLREGQEVFTGDYLGRATKCGMLHLEIYEGNRRDRGSGGHVQKVAVNQGWYLFDEFAPGGAAQWTPISASLPRDQLVDICASTPAYRNILTQTGNTLLDPRAFLISIANNDCTPGSTFRPGQGTSEGVAGTPVPGGGISFSSYQFINFANTRPFGANPPIGSSAPRTHFENSGGIHVFQGVYPKNVDVFLLFHGINDHNRDRSYFTGGTEPREFEVITQNHITAGGKPVVLVELIGFNYESYENIPQSNFDAMVSMVKQELTELGFENFSWNVVTHSRSTGYDFVRDYIENSSQISRLNVVLRGESTFDGDEAADNRLTNDMRGYAAISNHVLLFISGGQFTASCRMDRDTRVRSTGNIRWKARDRIACNNLYSNSPLDNVECHRINSTSYWNPGTSASHLNLPNEFFMYGLQRFFRGTVPFTDAYTETYTPAEPPDSTSATCKNYPEEL